MHLIERRNTKGRESGQLLTVFALWLPLLLLFTGLAIDFGFGFLTKTKLAKAADAAALATMRNLGKGYPQAKALGQDVFYLNVNTSSNLYTSAPTPNIQILTVNGQPTVNVTASAQIRTFFIGLAGFKTLNITDFSQVTRPVIILSLVLDRSGSMNDNGGATALPPAVTDFLSYFVQGVDQLGEVSFSTTASNDVPITKRFLTPINNSLNSMNFGGGTFAQGGLTDGNGQVTGVSPMPSNAVQVVVFFTDGWANAIQSTVSGRLVDFGGCAGPEFQVGWCTGVSCWDAANGNSLGGYQTPSIYIGVTCDGVNSFTAQDTTDIPSNPAALNINNIGYEADYRAIQLANTMRSQGITVYSIGLGDKINGQYLQNLANDPASQQYNPNLPSGLFEDAPTAADLDYAFQTVAAKIVSRLTE